MTALYLLLNIGSLSIPFLYSFNSKMNFIQYWKKVLLSTSLVAMFFLVWDFFFTKFGVWGFNEEFTVGFYLLGMPIEEWLFFFCIPYASIFIYYALEFYKPQLVLPKNYTKYILFVLLFAGITLSIIYINKLYTFINFIVFSVVVFLALIKGIKISQRFLFAFIIILIPFFFINGILTGSIIHEPVVWYNNNENMGIRLATIPIEDAAYAFSLLYLNIFILERLKNKS